MKLLIGVFFAPVIVFSAEASPKKPKPEFQYQSGDIRVSIPTPEEPRVKAFGPESVKSGGKVSRRWRDLLGA